MSTFDKREEAFEKQFAHDEELRFKASARRDKLLAQWAAERLGKIGSAAESYVNEILVTHLQAPGEEGIFRKIKSDFDQANVGLSEHQLHRKMDELLQKAVAEVRVSG